MLKCNRVHFIYKRIMSYTSFSSIYDYRELERQQQCQLNTTTCVFLVPLTQVNLLTQIKDRHSRVRLFKDAPSIFHWRRAKDRRRRVGVGFLGGSSNPLPSARVSVERCELSQRGSGRSPDRPKVFHYFQHSVWPLLTLILLIVDYHATIGGQDPRAPPPLRTPCVGCSFHMHFVTQTMKKRSERRKHCTLAVVRRSQKIFAPPHRPPSRGAGRPKSNQLEMVTTFTYKPSLVRIDARNFELSWSQTHTHTHTHKQTNPQTGPITIHCAAKLSAQCNELEFTTVTHSE